MTDDHQRNGPGRPGPFRRLLAATGLSRPDGDDAAVANYRRLYAEHLRAPADDQAARDATYQAFAAASRSVSRMQGLRAEIAEDRALTHEIVQREVDADTANIKTYADLYRRHLTTDQGASDFAKVDAALLAAAAARLTPDHLEDAQQLVHEELARDRASNDHAAATAHRHREDTPEATLGGRYQSTEDRPTVLQRHYIRNPEDGIAAESLSYTVRPIAGGRWALIHEETTHQGAPVETMDYVQFDRREDALARLDAMAADPRLANDGWEFSSARGWDASDGEPARVTPEQQARAEAIAQQQRDQREAAAAYVVTDDGTGQSYVLPEPDSTTDNSDSDNPWQPLRELFDGGKAGSDAAVAAYTAAYRAFVSVPEGSPDWRQAAEWLGDAGLKVSAPQAFQAQRAVDQEAPDPDAAQLAQVAERLRGAATHNDALLADLSGKDLQALAQQAGVTLSGTTGTRDALRDQLARRTVAARQVDEQAAEAERTRQEQEPANSSIAEAAARQAAGPTAAADPPEGADDVPLRKTFRQTYVRGAVQRDCFVRPIAGGRYVVEVHQGTEAESDIVMRDKFDTATEAFQHLRRPGNDSPAGDGWEFVGKRFYVDDSDTASALDTAALAMRVGVHPADYEAAVRQGDVVVDRSEADVTALTYRDGSRVEIHTHDRYDDNSDYETTEVGLRVTAPNGRVVELVELGEFESRDDALARAGVFETAATANPLARAHATPPATGRQEPTTDGTVKPTAGSGDDQPSNRTVEVISDETSQRLAKEDLAAALGGEGKVQELFPDGFALVNMDGQILSVLKEPGETDQGAAGRYMRYRAANPDVKPPYVPGTEPGAAEPATPGPFDPRSKAERRDDQIGDTAQARFEEGQRVRGKAASPVEQPGDVTPAGSGGETADSGDDQVAAGDDQEPSPAAHTSTRAHRDEMRPSSTAARAGWATWDRGASDMREANRTAEMTAAAEDLGSREHYDSQQASGQVVDQGEAYEL